MDAKKQPAIYLKGREEDPMEISNQILRPLIDRLKAECQELYQQVSLHSSDEALQLKTFIQRKMRQLEMLGVSVSYASSLPEQPDLPVLRHTFRQLKLELRFAQRKWKRVLLSEARIRRNQEKRAVVSQHVAA